MKLIKEFLADRSANTAVEYGVLSVLFVLGVIGAWASIGNNVAGTMTDAANVFDAAD
ncbi:MAG: Flp family type IVb pilin [Rhizobiaceae bacterium]